MMRFLVNSPCNCLLWAVIFTSSWKLENNGIVVMAFSTTNHHAGLETTSRNYNHSKLNSNNVISRRNKIHLNLLSNENGDDFELLNIPKKKSNNNRKVMTNTNKSNGIVSKKKKKANRKKNSKRNNNKEGDDNKSNMNSEEDVKQTTIPGGSSLIFGMARRMMVWQALNMYTDSTATNQLTKESSSPNSNGNNNNEVRKIKPKVLPRWHPHAGISDINPSFRLKSPVMNNRGYAGVLQRNSRKRNKPSLYRYALRIYDKMRQLEAAQKDNNQSSSNKLTIRRSSTHHLSALVACSKLALWKESLRIYNEILQDDLENDKSKTNKNNNINSGVSEAMIHAIIRSCVRASKPLYRQYNNKKSSSSDDNNHYYSEPLDAARHILESMTEKHDILVTSIHVNPLAAAYMYVKMPQKANDLIESHLYHPVADVKQYDHFDQSLVTFHTQDIQDIQARDKGTYHIQISNAIAESDWEGAIQHLYDINSVGLNPSTKELNKWSEIHHYS